MQEKIHCIKRKGHFKTSVEFMEDTEFDLDEFLSEGGDYWISKSEYLDLFHPTTSSASTTLGFFPDFESYPVLEEIWNQEVAGGEKSHLGDLNYMRPSQREPEVLVQAVDLTSTNVPETSSVKVRNDSYQAEILEVLRAVCETHDLPLAQTWTSCHSEDKYRNCLYTVDAACYVNHAAVLGFHRACSEHHLFRGQGIVGEAFTTNKLCFSPDITSFIWEKYPLSHYAKFFHLRAAVAIPLRSIQSEIADFVLEFFLPIGCEDNEEQTTMLHSISITMQQVCQNLRIEGVVEAPEKEGSSMLPASMEFGYQGFEEPPNVMTSNWDPLGDISPDRNIFSKINQDSLPSEPKFSNTGQVTDQKRRKAKSEKNVSLEILQQYFAGSLRDAAKSLGAVCPATLQKICRKHGITRWPSRKIKKVSHSLKKLQVVLDSVQGAERNFQFSSLYENFTKSSEPNKQSSGSNKLSTPPERSSHPESSKRCQREESRFNLQTSNSVSSSSSYDCSSGSKRNRKLERTGSNILATSVSQQDFAEQFSSETGLMKVKAIYGGEKVRFRIQLNWGFEELKQEIVKRFGINDSSFVDLKYLDDDSEWVLLKCDADLRECVDVYSSSSVSSIRISVHRVVKGSLTVAD